MEQHQVEAQPAPTVYDQALGSPSAFTLDNAVDTGGNALNLHDYLAGMMSPGAFTASLPQHTPGFEGHGSPAAEAGHHPTPVNFADLLAEFTSAHNAFSPDVNGQVATTKGGDSSAETTSPVLAPAANGNGGSAHATGSTEAEQGQKTAQEILLEQLKALYPAATAAATSAPTPSTSSQPSPAEAQQHKQRSPRLEASHDAHGSVPPAPSMAHAHHAAQPAPTPSVPNGSGIQLDPDMQTQLHQWLSQSLGGTIPPPALQSPAPSDTYATPAPQHHRSASTSAHLPAHLHHHGQQMPPHSPASASYQHAQSAPVSHHASPMTSYGGPVQEQPYPTSGPSTPYGQPPAPSSAQPPLYPFPTSSMPISIPSYLAQNQLDLSAPPAAIQAQLTAMQLLVSANAQAHAHAQMQMQAQQQAQQHQQHQQQQQQQQQQQPHFQHGQHFQQPQGPSFEQQAPAPSQHVSNSYTPFDVRTSAPGTASSSYREADYMFSPLMSPAMTPHSAFTNASSLPPSVGPLPLVAPSDCFPPLTSPALGPQLYRSDGASMHSHHRNSLQGLVDGVGALSTQLPPGSPSNPTYSSPRVGPSDPALPPPSAGSSRRGASSGRSKTRPSPLIKPTDPAFERRRRKTQSSVNGSAAEKRASSSKNATASPYIEGMTQFAGSERGSSAFSAASSHVATSPGDGESVPSVEANGSSTSAASIDTPSPVDLAASSQQVSNGSTGLREAVTIANAVSIQAESDGLMGPPPSRPSSTSIAITPASLMNLGDGFSLNGLSSLSPAFGANEAQHPFDPVSSALSSLQNSPALLPEAEGAAAPLLAMPPAITEESFRAPPQPSASGKASKVRKTPSARASPALKPVDAKGKGKATVEKGSSGRKAASSKPPKIAPSPKIGPTRGTMTPDGLRATRGSGKSKDDKDSEIDVLGLPPAITADLTVDSLTASLGKLDNEHAPDTRKSSHKVAEQKRRDSLKLCFDELRRILPPILPYTDEQDRRPGDGNVGGQRHGEIDPLHPNKGVSKVALLRRSNEYLEILRERIDRRDRAISSLRSHLSQLRAQLGVEELDEQEEEVPGLDLDLDNLDKEEKQAGNLAFYEDLDFDEKVALGEIVRRTATSRRPSVSAAEPKPSRSGTRRSKRQQPADEMDLET